MNVRESAPRRSALLEDPTNPESARLRSTTFETVREIVSALGAEDPASQPRADLAGGSAGLALLFCYGAQTWDDGRLADLAVRHLDRALETLATTAMTTSLYAGSPGVAFVLEHLTDRIIAREAPDPLHAIDEFLLAQLDGGAWTADYDLVSGLVGIGTYALERPRDTLSTRVAERILDHLEAMAERDEHGARWHTSRELLPPHEQAAHPSGWHNLGLAHGVPGVIALLARFQEQGIGASRARTLLEEAIAWLGAQRTPCETGFGAIAGDSKRTREAWCYGSPGIACALLAAARSTGDPEHEALGEAVATLARLRPRAESGVVDAGLCHGSAGLLHLHTRMHRHTGSSAHREAALHWLEWTLASRCPGEGIAGFRMLLFDGESEHVWRSDPGFLTGVAGVGLALLAAAGGIEPEWERALLVS